MLYTLPPLPYDFDALEPHIDAATMRLHHGKHHQTYVDKLNAAVQPHGDLGAPSVEELLRTIGTLPEQIRGAVRNHGGGHANHSTFWENMSPRGGGDPSGDLAAGLIATFGTLAAFREAFTAAAVGVFGSGWAWLVVENATIRLVTRPNQDSPLMDGLVPLLGLDVWEHAYYLKYQNRRPDYVQAWWQVVNWHDVEQRFTKAKSARASGS